MQFGRIKRVVLRRIDCDGVIMSQVTGGCSRRTVYIGDAVWFTHNQELAKNNQLDASKFSVEECVFIVGNACHTVSLRYPGVSV
jgi:hypothetical protein